MNRVVRTAGLGVALLVGAAALAACLPNPQSVKERRLGFDRSELKGRLILESPPADMHRVDAVFGDSLRLLGYTLNPAQPARGSRVEVTYYWSALRPIAEDYMVFIHGDAIGGRASRLHADHYPAKGDYPTDVWQVGEVVVDRFTVGIPPGYGGSAVGLHSGLYKGNYRVPLTDAGRAPGGRDNRSMAVRIQFN